MKNSIWLLMILAFTTFSIFAQPKNASRKADDTPTMVPKKIDTENSEITEARKVPNSNNFRVKIKLRSVSDSETASEKIKILGQDIDVIGCSIVRNNAQTATTVPAEERSLDGLSFTCKLPLSLRTISNNNLNLQVEFRNRTENTVFSPSQNWTIPILQNEVSIKTEWREPIWLDGKREVSIPVKVNQTISASLKLKCAIQNTFLEFAKEDIYLVKNVEKTIPLKLTETLEESKNCRFEIEQGDSLSDYIDFKFVDEDNNNFKQWISRKLIPYEINLGESPDLNQEFLLIDSFKSKKITIVTRGEGELKMFIGNGTTPEQTISNKQINEFEINPERIFQLQNRRFHKIRFEGEKSGMAIKQELNLIVDTRIWVKSSKIGFDKGKFKVEYELSYPVKTKLRFPELPDFNEVNLKDSDCNEGKCARVFEEESSDFIQKVASKLKTTNKNQETLTLEIISLEGNPTKLGEIKFEVTKPTEIDPKKAEAFNTLADQIKNTGGGGIFGGGGLNTQQKNAFVDQFVTQVLGKTTNDITPEEKASIEFLVEKLKKEENGKSKFFNILKFAGRVGLSYFGLPILF